jgi:hypothetical protein
MPEETNETATPKPRAAIHPKELSSEYHKAHKQLMLWATILLIWELIGVDLGKAKDAGGNIGPIVTALAAIKYQSFRVDGTRPAPRHPPSPRPPTYPLSFLVLHPERTGSDLQADSAKLYIMRLASPQKFPLPRCVDTC